MFDGAQIGIAKPDALKVRSSQLDGVQIIGGYNELWSLRFIVRDS
jgi:hypothetical protein